MELPTDITGDLQRAASGDADALQRMIVHYHDQLAGRVRGAIESELRTLVDPEDILQQAYISAFRSIGECDFRSPAGFYKWLEAIALHRLSDLRRQLRAAKRDVGRRAVPVARSSSSLHLLGHLRGKDSTPSRKLARAEAAAAMLSSLARLSEDRRTVIRMRYLEGREVSEIAEQLGKSESAIYQLCSRGLASLRQLLTTLTTRRPA